MRSLCCKDDTGKFSMQGVRTLPKPHARVILSSSPKLRTAYGTTAKPVCREKGLKRVLPVAVRTKVASSRRGQWWPKVKFARHEVGRGHGWKRTAGIHVRLGDRRGGARKKR